MRYRFIEAEKATYPVTMLCRVLKVSRSGFYAWHKRPTVLGQRRHGDSMPRSKSCLKPVSDVPAVRKSPTP